MKTKLTPEIIVGLGFKPAPNLIQESWTYIIKDVKLNPITPIDNTLYHYKSLSVSPCNDKGNGEYYLFMREGTTESRIQDDLVCLTSNLLYKEDLETLLNIITE